MKVLLSLAIASISLSGCKPLPDTSAGKSLDNFAHSGNDQRPNQCGLAITKDRYQKLLPSAKKKIGRIITSRDELRLAAASALTAVPKPMQTFFYGSGGRIILSDDVGTDCKDAQLTAGEKEFVDEQSAEAVGCWRRKDRRVEIVLAANEQVIRHNTLRMFAYLYTQYFVERFAKAKLPGGLAERVADGIFRFAKQRSALASAFLADLTKANSPALERLLRLEAKDPTAFENLVFAEAVDSFFCSGATHGVFRKQFPETFRAFSGGANAVASDFGTPWYR